MALKGTSKTSVVLDQDVEPQLPAKYRKAGAKKDTGAVPPKAAIRSFSGADLQAEIDKVLKVSTWEPEHRFWLRTPWPELNSVFGSRDLGIPYGKILELSGEEHGGKTLLSTVVAGLAQQDGAGLGRIDVEDSRDELWEARLGVDPASVVSIYPRMIKTKKDDPPVLESAEALFTRAETGMALLHKRGFTKQFWWLDSIANLQTEMVLEAGTNGQNMRTAVDRAVFLSQVLPKWAGLAANYNATIFLINQLREKPGKVFGNPLYSPGGRGVRHNAAIRALVKRLQGGQLRKGSKIIGIVGCIKNIKNKAGGGSVQSCECGFKVRWDVTPAKIEFMTKDQAEEMLKP